MTADSTSAPPGNVQNDSATPLSSSAVPTPREDALQREPTTDITAAAAEANTTQKCSRLRARLPSWKTTKAFLLKHFLVIGLVTAVVFSLACPWPGAAVDSVEVGSYSVFATINIITIFIISGLTLRTQEIKDAARQWYAGLVGVVSIMLLTPSVGFALVELPFTPPAYSYGLTIFALCPTTIASGITLVRAARGNDALALMLTVVTNVLSVFVLPFTVPLVISQAGDVSLDPVSLLVKLVITILVPLAVGKLLQELIPWVRKQVAAHKTALSLINNGSLICIVWQTLSAAQGEVVNTAFGTLCLIAVAAVLLHVLFLVVNFAIVKLLRLPHRESAAVLIMGAEKTLPMAVSVIAALPSGLGTAGQLTVPCVLAHISQVLIDAFMAERIGKRSKAREAAAAAKEALPVTNGDVAAAEESTNGGLRQCGFQKKASSAKLDSDSSISVPPNEEEGTTEGHPQPITALPKIYY